MSVLKYKDASGNWIAADTFVTGTLKVDVITPMENGLSFDLTKYQQCNRFFLYYTGNLNRSLFDSANPDGMQYRVDADAGTTQVDKGYACVLANGDNYGAIAVKAGNSPCYTYENGIFTWTQSIGTLCRLGDSALVIYAN